MEGGYDESDVHIMDTEQVKKGTTDDLKQLSPIIKALGSEGDLIRSHKDQAAQGDTFLLAYAPSELDTERLMNVVRRCGFRAAHKYDRFTITRL